MNVFFGNLSSKKSRLPQIISQSKTLIINPGYVSGISLISITSPSHSAGCDCMIKDYYFPLQALRHYVGVQFPPEASANLRTALICQAQR